jgi:hypothetical protein
MLLAIRWPVLARASRIPTEKRTDQELIEFGYLKSRVYRLTGWGRTFWSELIAVVAFYFVFLTVIAAVIIGLFNISKSERVPQDPRPGVERKVTATKREPRLFMVVPKPKHDCLQRKAANSAAVPTAKANAKKSKHDKSRAGFNGGYQSRHRPRRVQR